MSRQAQRYADQDLYGASGQPQPADIEQDLLNNCYLVSSMGALAAQQPDRIRDAIRYESDPGNPSAGIFHVTLHHPVRGQVDVQVTQADVEYNIQKGGGGTADNRKGGPLWPSVMETAFAKLHDPNPADNSLKDAYEIIADPRRGGSLHEAMFALTGDQGHNLRYSGSPKGSSAPPGNTGEDPPFDVPLRKENVTRFDDANSAYTLINEALGAGKSVTLSTRNADVDDGLMPHHAYVVTGIERHEKKDGTQEIWVAMRNPYAHNKNNPAESKDTPKPDITVSLDKMLAKDVFGEINLGPAPRVQSQQQGMPSATDAPAVQDASPAYNPGDITDEKHPGHTRFQQAVRAIENSPNIPSGTFSGERLHQAAANIALASLAGEERGKDLGRNEALSRIDFVVFNDKRDALIAGQGELNNPTAKLAWLSGAQENATSLAAASQKMHDLLQDPQKLELANPGLRQMVPLGGPELEAVGPRR